MRFPALTAAALLVAGLAGCSTPADTGSPAAPEASPSAGTEARPDASACGGLTTEDLIGLFNVDLEGPDPEAGSNDQNGVTWTSAGCDWEGEGLEIDLDISESSDFADGKVACIEPGGVGDVTAVDGIGDRAWWKFDDFNEVEGELRVCTEDQLIELAVDAETGSMSTDELREKVTRAMRIVTD